MEKDFLPVPRYVICFFKDEAADISSASDS